MPHRFLPAVYLSICALCLLLTTGCGEEPPVFLSIDPESGSALELITLRGENIGEIRELLFNDQPINFNTAYNSDNALLFRIPEGTPLGMYVVTVRTDGGSFTFDFLVSEPPPRIARFSPRNGDPGEEITIIGENYFEPPLEVYFRNATVLSTDPVVRDSIRGEIVYVSETKDTMRVIVPEGVSSGPITVVANGGETVSLLNFFTFGRQLVSDFDGGGERGDFSTWIARGNLDQLVSGAPFLRSTLPAGTDGDYLQISGVAPQAGQEFVGFIQSPATADSFDIDASIENAFLEFDVNSGGRANSYLAVALREREGGVGDFVSVIELEEEAGWEQVRIPMVRFRNSSNLVVTPGRVNVVKFILLDRELTGRPVQANIDNINILQQE